MAAEKISPVLKIITVDDSSIIVERLQTMISEMDYVQYMGNARNISAALNLIIQHEPNVVILDIHLEEDMPKANGMNLLITLREKYKEMKIIMLTNLTGRQYKDTCLFMGANYFFDKSNEFEKIPEAMKEISMTQYHNLQKTKSRSKE